MSVGNHVGGIDLASLARSDPAKAIRIGESTVADVSTSGVDKAVALQIMSSTVRSTSIVESISYGRRSLHWASDGDDEDVWLNSVETLSDSLALGGQGVEAVSLLEDAASETGGMTKARLELQRGSILRSLGLAEDALDALDDALSITTAEGDLRFEADVRAARGNALVMLEDPIEGRRELLRSRSIYEELDLGHEVAEIDHNLGTVALVRGDIPRALELFDRSARGHCDVDPEYVTEHTTKAEALIAAGRYEEALAEANTVGEAARAAGSLAAASAAYDVACRAALLAGRNEEVSSLAIAARASHQDMSQDVRLAEVDLFEAIALWRRNRPTDGLASIAGSAGNRLEDTGRQVFANEGRLIAGQIELELLQQDLAQEWLTKVAETDSGPVEILIQARLAESLLQRAAGNSAGVTKAARAGLNLLEDYEASLSSSDLRFGIERWGAELGALGLHEALESGRPRRVFEWMERTKARELVSPNVVPYKNGPEQNIAFELRLLESWPTSLASDHVQLAERRKDLQDQIKAHDLSRRGETRHYTLAKPEELIEQLGDGELIEMTFVEDQLLAVHVSKGRFKLVEIGSRSEAEAVAIQARDMLSQSVDDEAVIDALARLDEVLLGQIKVGAESLVIVPPSELMSVPWSGLPRLVNSEVVVSPSATLWLESMSRPAFMGDVHLVAGPGPAHADSEIEQLGVLYPSANTHTASSSSVAAVATTLPASAVVHFACDVRFAAENPMFSALVLSDGDLNLFDIERLDKVPDLVVLSASGAGLGDADTGQAIAGLATTLLRKGTKSVVVAVGDLPDSSLSTQFVVAFHRAINRGSPPAAALKVARDEIADDAVGVVTAASFVCIGAG